MKSPSQAKVSTISFLITLLISILVFGIVAYFGISAFFKDEPTDIKEEVATSPENEPDETHEIIPPEEIEKIEGESFTLLVAGYGLNEDSFDAMVVIDVNKEEQRVSVHPINPDTNVYVGYADGLGNLNVRLGDLIKYKDMNYVVGKLNATTGIDVTNYVTFTAQGFITAFDEFNEDGDYTYVVPKDMEHVYAEPSPEGAEALEGTEEVEDLTVYNISFKKGDKLTSGLDIYNMLRYKGDSESERFSRQSAFVRDILQKIIPSYFKEGKVSGIVSTVEAVIKIANSIKTDMNAKTFITETFDLISKIPEFSFDVSSKYTKGTINFK